MNHMDTTLEGYRAQVQRFAVRRDGELFLNSGSGYAKIVIDTIFKNASRKLDIYSGGLDEKIYTIDMFDALLSRGVSSDDIRVVVSEADTGKLNRMLIRDLIDREIEIKKFPDTGSHIVLADDSMYRFEYDHSEQRAMCSFGSEENQPPKIGQLINTFASIWQKSQPIERGNAAPL